MTSFQPTSHRPSLGLATQPTILIFTLERCGAHWLGEMISDLTGLPSFYHSAEDCDYGEETIAQINELRENTVLIRRICLPPDRLLRHTAALEIPVILLYRDPRDLVASFVSMTRAQDRGSRRDARHGPAVDEILDWEVARFDYFYGAALAAWAAERHALLAALRYEELIADTPAALARLAEFLGLDAPRREIERIAADHALPDRATDAASPRAALTAAADPRPAAAHHLVGNHRRQFTQAQQRRLNHHLCDVLRRLGYETDGAACPTT
jgi:LPS sulfotransferase NodH